MSDKATTEGKAAAPGDDTGAKTADTQNVPSAGGHEDTGYEKLMSSGGSGGMPIRGGQGYEHLADHK